MKKILGAAAALSLIGSAAFADITVSGRGYVETQVFNYKTDAAGKNGETKLFDNWDTGDSDVFVSGDIGGKAGAMLNIDFGPVANGYTISPTPVDGKYSVGAGWIGDWNVWIKPLDFLTIKASNEANRVANRYNSIIDKTESKWGTLLIEDDKQNLNYKDANDDDSFKGYQVNMDFGVVKVDLGFNKAIQENGFAASSMAFGNNLTEIGTGARVVVPVEGLLNVDAFFKMYMNDVAVDTEDKTKMTFGAIVDVVAIDNMGLAIGYIGHSDKEGKKDSVLTSAVDIRFQYNMDKMGFALHNNATFKENVFANKTNLGFMYGLTDAANLYVEVQNYLASFAERINADGKKGQTEGVTLKTGLRADFGLTEDFKQLEIALPLSMEVIF